MRIFSKQKRTDTSPSTETEEPYVFLNRIGGVYWDDVRALMEEWFSRYPDDKALGLIRRLQADAEGFWGAYLELFLHQLLLQLGASLKVEPEVPEGRKPDFRLSIDGRRFLVEAKAVLEPEKAVKRNRRTAQVMDGLRKVQSADFMISLDNVVQGSEQPSGKRMAAQLDEWLSKLKWEEVRATARRSSSGLPTAALTDREWEVTVRPIPRAEDKRILGPIVIAPPFQGREVADYAAIKEDLQEKASKYRSSGEPIVLALMNTRWTAETRETAIALFGAAWEHPRMLRQRRVDPSWRTSPEGLWLTRSGLQYGEVGAVLDVERVSPWHLAEGRVTAWHNPATPMSAIKSLALDHINVGPEGTLDRSESPRSLVDVLGIPANWPRGEAFPKD